MRSIKQRWNSIRTAPAERISKGVLAVIVTLAIMVFVLFYMVGFNMPFLEDPAFQAPLFTDLLLCFAYAVGMAAVALTVVAIVNGLKARRGMPAVSNGIRVKPIAWGVAIGWVLTMTVSFACGDDQPLMVNGETYDDRWWLRMTDMFINTTLVLMAVAVAVVGVAATGWNRTWTTRRDRHERV